MTLKAVIPEKWNPKCKDTMAQWFDKIGAYQSKEDTLKIQKEVIG